MRNYGRGRTEYKKPVSLANAEKLPKLKVITNVYVKNGEEYVYAKECSKEFPFNSIIMKVKIELKDNGNFTLDAKDKATLEEFIESVSKEENFCLQPRW